MRRGRAGSSVGQRGGTVVEAGRGGGRCDKASLVELRGGEEGVFSQLLLLLLPLLGRVVGVLLLHLSRQWRAEVSAVEVKGRRHVSALAKGEGHAMRLREHGGGSRHGVGLQRLGLLVRKEMGRRSLLIRAEICGRPLRIRGLGVDVLGVLRRLGGIVLHPFVPVGHVVSGRSEGHVVASGGEPRSAHVGEGEVARQHGILHLGRGSLGLGSRRVDGRGTWRQAEVVKHTVGADLDGARPC